MNDQQELNLTPYGFELLNSKGEHITFNTMPYTTAQACTEGARNLARILDATSGTVFEGAETLATFTNEFKKGPRHV